MFGFIIIGPVGIFLFILGYLVMVKKKTTLIHDFHLEDVKDIENYCRWIGGCTLILGIILTGLSILGLAQVIAITRIKLFILITCIAGALTLLIIQKKITGHIL